jgi:hypothetical protein
MPRWSIKKGIPNYSLSMSDIYLPPDWKKNVKFTLSVIYDIKKYPKLLSEYDEQCLAYTSSGLESRESGKKNSPENLVKNQYI